MMRIIIILSKHRELRSATAKCHCKQYSYYYKLTGLIVVFFVMQLEIPHESSGPMKAVLRPSLAIVPLNFIMVWKEYRLEFLGSAKLSPEPVWIL